MCFVVVRWDEIIDVMSEVLIFEFGCGRTGIEILSDYFNLVIG